MNSAPPYVYVENDRIVGGDPADPLVYLGRGRHEEATPITEIPPEASQRTANMFKGAVEAHKKYNDYTVGTVLAEKAVDWITANKQQPFFLYLATTHIHHPFTPGKHFQGTSEAELYGDFIQELDWMVGEVTQCLEKQGLSENTLVIFTSDNGGMLNLGGRNAVKAGHHINGDLLGFKFGAWEGGHRVPFIAKWPGKIEAGHRIRSADLQCRYAGDLHGAHGAGLRITGEQRQRQCSARVAGEPERAAPQGFGSCSQQTQPILPFAKANGCIFRAGAAAGSRDPSPAIMPGAVLRRLRLSAA